MSASITEELYSTSGVTIWGFTGAFALVLLLMFILADFYVLGTPISTLIDRIRKNNPARSPAKSKRPKQANKHGDSFFFSV